MAAKRAATTDEPARKSARATKAAVVDDSNSEKSEDDRPPPKKKAAKKVAKKTKKAKADSDEEDDDASDFEEAPVVKKARAAPKEKVAKVEVIKLAVGDQVEDVTLVNENGEDVVLSSLYSAGGLVLFSYPKASTPGCTTQACLYRDTFDDITATGFAISGLSGDKPAAQLTWKTKQNFQYGLLSDPKSILLAQLGQIASKKRCHWIISKEGKLLEAAIGVKPADDATNVLAFIKAL